MSRRNTHAKHQFDFDIGHLKRSPCKGCHLHPTFPVCSEHCLALDRIQTTLARGISTTHTHSPLEPFAVFLESWNDN